MELGCDGVLVNTAIAKAKKPFDMALAFKNGKPAQPVVRYDGRNDTYVCRLGVVICFVVMGLFLGHLRGSPWSSWDYLLNVLG